MEVQKKYRWALTGLIVMILLNAATLITIWVNQSDKKDWNDRRGSDHDQGSMQEYMQKELDITEDQAQTIIDIRRGHYREIRSFRDSLEKNRRTYFEFVMSDEAEDQAKRDSLLNLLSGQYENIEGLLYQHMTEIKEILDEDQQQKFEELMLNTFFKGHSENRQRQYRGNR